MALIRDRPSLFSGFPEGTPRMSREESALRVAEMRSLVLSHEVRDAARDRCITSCIGLMGWVMRRSSVDAIYFQDLLSYLSEVLVVAVDKFNPSRGTDPKRSNLPGYVAWKLKQETRGFANRFCLLIHVPESATELLYRPIDPKEKYGHERRAAASQAMAARAGESPHRRSADADILRTIEGRNEDLDDQLDREETKLRVRQAIAMLPPMEAEVIRTSFGIDVTQETLRSIGNRISMSYSWTSIIRKRALEQLRDRLAV